jgi:hypothetical protein
MRTRLSERGQASAEYLAVIVLVTALALAFVVSGRQVGESVTGGIEQLICKLVGQGCSEQAAPRSYAPQQPCQVSSNEVNANIGATVFSVKVGADFTYTKERMSDGTWRARRWWSVPARAWLPLPEWQAVVATARHNSSVVFRGHAMVVDLRRGRGRRASGLGGAVGRSAYLSPFRAAGKPAPRRRLRRATIIRCSSSQGTSRPGSRARNTSSAATSSSGAYSEKVE